MNLVVEGAIPTSTLRATPPKEGIFKRERDFSGRVAAPRWVKMAWFPSLHKEGADSSHRRLSGWFEAIEG